jgi:hypothetical protein
VSVRYSLRRGIISARLVPAMLLVASLVLNGCPMTSVARSGKGKAVTGEEPGPPTVLNPSLLDRG